VHELSSQRAAEGQKVIAASSSDAGLRDWLGGRDRTRAGDSLATFLGGIRDYAIFVLDRNGNVVSWPAGARAIKGFRPEQILGQHFSVLYTPEEIHAGEPESDLDVAAAKKGFAQQGWRARRDGSRFWASVSLTPLWRDAGEARLRGFVSVVHDDTERRRTDQERTRIAMLDTRDAIVVDLHDQVVHGLFAAGLSLQGTLGLVDSADARSRLEQTVEDLDDIIHHIRSTLWPERQSKASQPATP